MIPKKYKFLSFATLPPGDVRNLFLAGLTGALLVCAFPKPDLGLIAFVALVPLLISIRQAKWRKAAGLGFIAGLIFFAGSLYWITPTVVQYGSLPWAVALGILLLLAGYLAIYFAGFAAGVAFLGQNGVIFVLFTGGLWVTFELLRSRLLIGFPWNLLGHSQYQNLPLIQIADATGVYGISFVVAAVNAGIADGLVAHHGWRKRASSFATAGLLVSGAVIYGWVDQPRIPRPEIRVALLQGNISQDIKWDPRFQDETMAAYQNLTLAQTRFHPDLVIWPETAVPFFLRHDQRLVSVEKLADEINSSLLVSAPDRDGRASPRYTVSAFLIKPKIGITSTYDKIRLVPFGEYVPLKRILFFVTKLTQGAVGEFSPGTQMTVFPIPAGKFSVSISYEIYFATDVRRFVQKGAEFLVNITNDAWYGRSAAPYQHLSMVVFRAVENRRYLVRAANTGISAIVDPNGRIVSRSDLFESTAVRGTITANSDLTFYARYGDIFAWGIVSIVGIGLLIAAIRY